MAKLFALENADLETGNEFEMEASPEQGEVADVQVEVEQDLGEVEEIASGVDEGMGAADQLEEVEALVAKSGEEGEGLDPVAAEAVRLAVEAICARVGANPKAVYSLYATENFRSVSSRKANTKIALEGIGEFLKNLWEKIKTAVTNLWEKVKAFWDKHLSSLGRLAKAMESMKAKISQVKGNPSFEAVTVPASLQAVFPVKGANLGVDEVKGYIERVKRAETNIADFQIFNKILGANELTTVSGVLTKYKTDSGNAIVFGNADEPVAGGAYYNWTFKIESEPDDGVDIITIDVEEDHGKFNDNRKEAQMDIASKDALKKLVTDSIADVKELVKRRDKFAQRSKAVTANMKAISKHLDTLSTGNTGATNAALKQSKANMRTFNLLMTKGPMLEAKLLGIQLATYKGVLQYTDVCLKNFKKV